MRSKIYIPIVAFSLAAITALSFTLPKKKKFIDLFSNYKLDTLTVTPLGYESISEKSDLSLLGNFIDTNGLKPFRTEGAEDLRYFASDELDKGPAAYQKIKLDLGFYFLIIRSGGEYFNSRFYGCLYNAGSNEITSVIVLADELGDAGYVYTGKSTLKKVDKQWTIYTHSHYSEPVDYEKYEMDSIQVTDVHIVTSIQPKDEHYFFVEESRTEKSYHQ